MAEPEPLRTSRMKNLVAVVRDSLLQGMEDSIYQPDLRRFAVCWRSHIQDVVKRLAKLIKPDDYNSMLHFLGGTNVILRGDLRHIKHDYSVKWTEFKGMGPRWCSP